MRLTLRTLLAYLDGILDPKDSADLGKKIEDSDFATNLVHRIRDVMRRLRLGAPSLEERGPGFDPNTVAEYLDNTLPTDRVTDFEKVCLDSDVHLAEVAACHQVLTLVLGEPAEVEPDSRQRMYQLKDIQGGPKPPATPLAPGETPAPVQPLDLGIDAAPEPLSRRQSRPRPTVPEYLREPRKRPVWVPVTAAVVLLVCLTFVVLKLSGQTEPGSPLGDALVRWGLIEAPKQVAVEPNAGTASTDKTEAASPGTDRGTPSGTEKATPPAKPLPDAAQKPTAPAVEPGQSELKQPDVKQPTIQQPGREPVDASPRASLPDGASPKVDKTGAIPAPGIGPTAKPDSGTKPEAAVKPETASKLEPAPRSEPKDFPDGTQKPAAAERKSGIGQPSAIAPKAEPKAADSPATIAKNDPNKEPKAEPAAEPAPLPPEPLGRLMSTDQVLLIDDPASGWTRVAPNQVLLPRQLLVLPTYRPRVALTAGAMSGITLEFGGATRLELLGPRDPQDPAGIAVFYGRVLMMPLAKPGTKLRLTFGDHAGVLTFDDADAVVAVDVRRIRTPGTNPETEAARVTTNLHVTTGNVTWQEIVDGKLSEPLQIAASQRLSFDGPAMSLPVATKELPRWITTEPMSVLDRRASPAIGQALPSDGPARVGLLELATSRPQKEVKWLAMRCLSFVGQFRDIVAALNDPARKLDWPDYIDELRAAVSRDPETAAAVRIALEKQYPQQSPQLYRMLWGYSDKDLEGGEDEQLVKALDDESLAVRVLSVWNLKDITGLGQYYQPEQTAARRQQSVRRWRQRLDAKEVRLKTPEEKAGAAARESTSPSASPRETAPPVREAAPIRETAPPAAPLPPE